jgi:ribosomal protein L12E/L44/L45/RPP1/RPP2
MGTEVGDKKIDKETYMALFKGLLGEITSSSEEALLVGGKKILDDPNAEKYFADNRTIVYIYLSGLLNLLGREINTENMGTVLKGIGAEANTEIMNVIVNANKENAVIYIYSAYFLVMLGKELNIKNVVDLVRSLGEVAPNEAFAKNAIDVYNRRYGEKL